MIQLSNLNEDRKSYEISAINKIFNGYFQELASCSDKISKYNKFYQKCISDMRSNFVDLVANKCYLYSSDNGWNIDITTCKTINELLHLFHQRVINDERLYYNLPVTAEKPTIYEDYDFIRLYGQNSNVGKEIFDALDNVHTFIGEVNILALGDEYIFVTIKELAHALTIEIIKENNDYFINYNIPKICNIRMINDLPGVRKVNKNSSYTGGYFISSTKNLVPSIIDFIGMVPSDNKSRSR